MQGAAPVAERFEVFRYAIIRFGAPPETRFSFAPMKGVGEVEPAGHIMAPDGTRIASLEPPMLEIPGRGQVDLLAVIGVTEGEAREVVRFLRWHPEG
jgi:hypothetical protein